MKKLLTKDDTLMLKGAGVLLMLMHHLWAFPDRIAGDGLRGLFYIGDMYVFTLIGHFGKICVPLFFFLGGYGLYKKYENRPFDMAGQLRKLYVSYWKVFVIFIPIAFLFFGNQGVYTADEAISGRYNVFSIAECIRNFLTLSDSYNGEWWFLRCYALSIICFPLIKRVVSKCSLAINLAIVAVLVVLFGVVFYQMGVTLLGEARDSNYFYVTFGCYGEPFPACFVMGAVCARFDLIDKLRTRMKKKGALKTPVEILLLFVIILFRQILLRKLFDVLYIMPFSVILVDLTDRFKSAGKVLRMFGRESTNMWFIHSFYCYYFYGIVRIVIAPRWAVPSFLILFLLSYGSARAVSELYAHLPNIRHTAYRRCSEN